MIHCIRIKLRMKVQQVLFFCFLSAALQDGNSGLSNAVSVFAGAEGGKGSMACSFRASGDTAFFCKGECKGDGILIKTEDSMARSGRYNVRYEDGSSGKRQVTVTITQLSKSDEGRYKCGLGGSLVPDVYDDFHLMITDEATLGSNDTFILTETVGGRVTVTCRAAVHKERRFFCRGECTKEEDVLLEIQKTVAHSGRYGIEFKEDKDYGLHVTITQLRKSDTGMYKCGYGSPLAPLSVYSFPIIVVDAPPTPEPKRTPAPFTASVPSASTPAPTQNLGFTPSSAVPETTNQPEATAATTEEPNWTLGPFPTSVPSASTAATQRSSSGSFTPSSSGPTEQISGSVSSTVSGSDFVLPLVVCVLVAAGSLVPAVLLYRWKKRRNSDQNSKNVEVPAIYEKLGRVPAASDSSSQIGRV
ncbi:uncharacterized protein LOC133976741 [Scomber scombrus]|uniref:uncharacterized protein LOC133976741 n=1 Tax=Scomber scombrus TaxID=13677 RepID=UPI002DD9F23E|nr:uncharacterized protein LOC133976741 [Scomber scombrus]